VRQDVLKDAKAKFGKEYAQLIRRQDYGGNFTSSLATYEDANTQYNWVSSFYRYTGQQLIIGNADYTNPLSALAGPWRAPPIAQDVELFGLGGTAISRCAPTAPAANVMTALAELRNDGLPRILGLDAFRKKFRPSAGGGEYLNYQFAIKPFISDLQDIVKAVKQAHTILSQYERDSGKIVRRSYGFDPVYTSETVEVTPSLYPALPSSMYRTFVPKVTRKTIRKDETWFDGAFTYHVDSGAHYGVTKYLQEANRLFGIGITPSVIYNVTPWSWAFDWFFNLGDVLSNLSMALTDGLAMPYGYIMRKTTQTVTYTLSGVIAGDGTPITPSQTFTIVQKLRRRASPFGFGLAEGDLTPRQLAIAAALGLTMGGKRIGL